MIMLVESDGPWLLTWREPCNCCKGEYRFKTKRSALEHIPRLSRPFRSIGRRMLKRDLKLIRFDFELRKLEKISRP